MVFDYLAKILKLQKLLSAGMIVMVASCSMATQQSAPAKQIKREVAVTFDDLPATHGEYSVMKSVTDNLLAKLKTEKVPAIGFVNEFKLLPADETVRRTALLNQWLNDGHDLGNHTYSHIYIDQATFDEYTADLIRGETATRKLLQQRGKKLTYYRHTQLRTGPTEEYKKRLAEFLAKRGYTVAPVTIDNNDFIFALAYSNAKRSGDTVLQEKVVLAYVDYMETVFDHFEKLSREFLGYEVKQTLLLHANEINADHFDKLAQMLKKRGYAFITLNEALKDKAYQLPEAQSNRGLSWLHRWMLAKGLAMKEEPLQPDWITKLSQQRNP